MAEYWREMRKATAAGVLWQDPDIVVDPDDMEAMRHAIETAPEFVHCSVHKLWPASTMREEWVFGHGEWKDNAPVMGQKVQPRADWFALGFTYTPARLLQIAYPHMFQWVFGQIDSGLSATARQHYIPAFPVLRCRPKHLHFYPREDDASWRAGQIAG